MKKHLFIFVILFFSLSQVIDAQVGIGTTTPDASAELEITATDKGMLIPRMTLAERDLIASPATSLLVFQTDNTPGYYYYNGSNWEKLTIDSNSPANFSMISVYITNGGLAYQTTGVNTWQTLIFDTEDFDTNAEFDTATHRFTALNTGFYKINAQYTSEGHDDREELGIGIFVNGSIIAEQSFDHTGDLILATLGTRLVTRQISKLVQLNTGDYVEIKVKDKNTTLTIDKWSGKTFFTINRVR